jgi:hypothetical protein
MLSHPEQMRYDRTATHQDYAKPLAIRVGTEIATTMWLVVVGRNSAGQRKATPQGLPRSGRLGSH